MFSTILIANRGEIACRVAATARRMGLRTVAVYSDADADSRHVAACDTAIHIGGSEPRQSYLRGDVVLAAARAAGADAIHPGYGFLSENEGFAQSVADAGLIFVGPPPSAIAAMGSKSAAKSLMEKAGVPLVPGYHGDDQDPALLHREADRIGYPVLIKASAGGGGKGMRVVESSAAFADALTSCKREAQASFGDDRVLIERYLQKPRHIEIQVFADTHGNCVHLFERDCSVQRRHQKVIEEAPAPGMTPERRKAMGDAAVAAARAVNYVGAGTVEFIVEPDGRFYFMEMNTRLQVEHPVTEFITGTDLVEWQLRVAAGEPLPAAQDMLQIHGHAIEARLYAENPDNGFLPSIGTLAHLALPPHTAFALGELRVDGGVRQGDTISPFYDPMIAKIIVSGADRDQARQRMIQALAATQVVGVQTNAAFLLRLMRDEAFAAADLDTGLIERRRATLLPEAGTVATSEDDLLLAAISQIAAPLRDGMNAAPTGTAVHAGGHAATGAASSTPQRGAWADPWGASDGWRGQSAYRRSFTFVDRDHPSTVTATRQHGQWRIGAEDSGADRGASSVTFTTEPAPDAADPRSMTVQAHLPDRRVRGTVIWQGERAVVFREGNTTALTWRDPLAHADDDAGDHAGSLTAPMPGKIIAVHVAAGDTVERGQALLVMEAMKMEHTITAPEAGQVGEVFFGIGDQVTDGAVLLAIEAKAAA